MTENNIEIHNGIVRPQPSDLVSIGSVEYCKNNTTRLYRLDGPAYISSRRIIYVTDTGCISENNFYKEIAK